MFAIDDSLPQEAAEPDKGWYLAYTKPRQEVVARENLLRQGYEVYLPWVRARRRRHGRVLVVSEPMFPRYLFIRLSRDTDNWAPIRSTYGISGLVYFGFSPARLPDGLIASLKAADDEEGVQQLPVREFRPGEPVRIADGVMAGYEGIYQARTGKERVSILLEFAGSVTQLDVSLHQLEPVQ